MPQARPFIAGDGARTSGEAGGLTPADLASAYAYDPTGGSGQTVAVVDAYNDPKIEEDLARFDAKYGLAACTRANGCLRVVGELGTNKLPPNDKEGWSYETSLDVEAVRAVCQGCRIVLVEAATSEYAHLATAANTAAALGATEVSNSYGGPEVALTAAEQSDYDHPGVVVTAATGDDGWYDWDYWLEGLSPPAMPNAPASLGSVVAVGGTSLGLDAEAHRTSETVWNDGGPRGAAGVGPGYVTGGGCSRLFTAPSWQSHAPGYTAAACAGTRLTADVAVVGDPLTGFDIYDDFNFCGCREVEEAIKEHKGWETLGGTSLSSPVVAAMYALAGGSRGLSDPGATLYAHLGSSSLYDVTAGGNGYCDGEAAGACGTPNSEHGATLDCEGTGQCDAGNGLDGPSGVGAPAGLAAFEPAFPTAVITPPPWVAANIAATFGSAASSDPYPGGAISGWKWSFGDGSAQATTPAATHFYAAAGHYVLTLVVQDGFGLSSSQAELPLGVLSEAEGRRRIEEEEEAARRAEAAARLRAEEAAAHGALAFHATTPLPTARLAGYSLRVGRAGIVHLRVVCPPGVGACSGKVTLRWRAVRARRIYAASASFSVEAGNAGLVALRLPAGLRSFLLHAGSARTRVVIATHDPAGTAATTQALVTLHAGGARRR
jgi:hypothetical protein